jgi:hypothetical protein
MTLQVHYLVTEFQVFCLIEETLANAIKQNTQQKGKEGTKKENPSQSQESKTQRGS